MNEMIERVARALAPRAWIEPVTGWLRQERRQSLRDARRAIAAMREPTEAMVQASNREWDGRMSHRSSGAYQAMIDEALRD